MDDIVERLRSYHYEYPKICGEAADEIERLRAITAAAEVGEPDAQAIERWEEEDKKDEVETRKLKNHTIDRCAQVAHSFRERFVNHPMEMADAIAAAIRKLKDK